MGKNKGKQVSLWLDEGLVVRVDKLAAKAGVTRTNLMENMVGMTVKSLENADALGVLSIAILLRDFETSLKAWVNEIRQDGENVKGYYVNGSGVVA